MDAICRFIPQKKVSDKVHTVNFVREKMARQRNICKKSATYAVFLITGGSGTVKCNNLEISIQSGDIFFVFPALEYSVCADVALEYMYISFFGVRASLELERIGVSRTNFVFEGFGGLQKIWEEGMRVKSEFSDIISESILLFTIASVADSYCPSCREDSVSEADFNAKLIKEFIDEKFVNEKMSLEYIAQEFSYSKKYISTMFKKHFKIGIVEYINTLRIHFACSLIEKNYSNVGEIAEKSGFNDALYFSKMFKKKTGISPKQYIMKYRREG